MFAIDGPRNDIETVFPVQNRLGPRLGLQWLGEIPFVTMNPRIVGPIDEIASVGRDVGIRV